MGLASMRLYVITSPCLVGRHTAAAHRARFAGAPRRGALYPLGPCCAYPVITRRLRRPVWSRERLMSQWSKVRHSRTPWQHKATQRAHHNRYQRKQLARVKHEQDRTATALKEAQARLRQLESQSQGLVARPKVDVVFLALQLFLVARIGFRAVSRVLSLLAWALGIKKAPCPQTILNWVMRLSIVRLEPARTLKGLPLRQAPFSNGLVWMIDISIGLGTSKMLAVLACDAHHHQRTPGALSLERVHCMGVGVAGMLKRVYQDHPSFETFLSVCGRVSGKLKHTILACLTPPKVRTKARFMHVHRLFTWADRVLKLSPPGGAQTGSTLTKLRACLDQLPTCKALITRFRADAAGLLACQKILKSQGLSHDSRAQCEPLIDTMPSSVLRQEFRAYLAYELETATTLGLDQIGVPISSDTIESLFGVAKQHGVGETQDAARIALRLPALCDLPTREEAEQVLDVSMARQQAFTGQVISLTTQRREVLGHPERLESLSRAQGTPHVELIACPKNRSNYQEIINISNGYEECHGPPLRSPGRLQSLKMRGRQVEERRL